MMTGARHSLQMSHVFASVDQMDVDKYGDGLEKDTSPIVLTIDVNLVVGHFRSNY